MIDFKKDLGITLTNILSVSEINGKCRIRYYYSKGLGQHTYKLHIIENCSFSSLINYIKQNRGKLQLAEINRKYWVNPKYVFEVEKKVHGSVWVKYGHKRKPYWIAVAEKDYKTTLVKLKRAWYLET